MDRRDRQVLEMLAQNCRLSAATLARALRVSKDTISYRIRGLEERELISRYVLFVDARRLGFTRFHLLLRFEHGFEITAKVLAELAAHPFVMWINTFVGCFDLQIIVDADSSFTLNRIRAELFEICAQRVKHYLLLTHLSDLEFTHLNPELNLNTEFDRQDDAAFSAQLTRARFPVGADFEQFLPETIDLEILRILAEDPRAAITAIAAALRCERVTVRKRIVALIRRGVILNFGAIPNISKMGFVTYYLLVRLVQNTPERALQQPFRQLRNIFYAGKMLGEYDLILYLNARNPDELSRSIAKFRQELGKYILNYDLLVQEQLVHWCQFTRGIYTVLREELRQKGK